jgi:hypothetical protein
MRHTIEAVAEEPGELACEAGHLIAEYLGQVEQIGHNQEPLSATAP